MISLGNSADRHKKWPFFYLRKQINLSAKKIKVCLDIKHWDRLRYTFAIRIAFMCAKLSPSSVCGTSMTLWYGTLLARLWPLARCHPHHRHHHGRRCCVLPSCLFPHTLRINCHCLIFIWVSRGCRICHQFQLFRSRFWCCFYIQGWIWFWFCLFGGIWIQQYILWVFCWAYASAMLAQQKGSTT